MCGCRRRARMLPSRRNRASPSRPTRLAFRIFTAASPRNRPSQRSASQTLPIPPWPIGETRRYAPTTWPARDATGRSRGGSADRREIGSSGEGPGSLARAASRAQRFEPAGPLVFRQSSARSRVNESGHLSARLGPLRREDPALNRRDERERRWLQGTCSRPGAGPRAVSPPAQLPNGQESCPTLDRAAPCKGRSPRSRRVVARPGRPGARREGRAAPSPSAAARCARTGHAWPRSRRT